MKPLLKCVAAANKGAITELLLSCNLSLSKAQLEENRVSLHVDNATSNYNRVPKSH